MPSPHDHDHDHDAAEQEPEPEGEHAVNIPALLRAARGAYGRSIADRLAAAGFDDVPRNGPYVLGGMVNHNGRAVDLVRQIGVSKEAGGRLIDTLVTGGYLQRVSDSDDLGVTVTERGVAAAAAIRAGVGAVDAELAAMLSPTELAGLRVGLFALITIRERWEAPTV